MEEVALILLGLVVAGYVLIAPAVAVVVAYNAARRRDDQERRIAWLEHRLAEMERDAPAAGRLPRTDLTPPTPLSLVPQERGEPERESNVQMMRSEPPSPEERGSGGLGGEVCAGEPPPRPPRSPAGPPRLPSPSFEEHVALPWLTRIGAAAFLLGALFFFKYAVDNAWIGPAGRVAVGGIAGTGLLFAAELIRAKTRAPFVHALAGIGVATLVVSTWASAVFYQLVPPTAAFGATTAVLFLGAALSYRYRGEAVLLLSLVGGFLNPIVLSTGQDRALGLFGYLFLLTAVAHGVSLSRGFRIVPWLSIAGVAVLFGGWYAKFFDIADNRAAPLADLPPSMLTGAYLELSARLVPLGAALGFGSLWAGVALGFRRRKAAPAFVKAVAVAALVLVHVAAALLLPDSPRLLALLAAGLAAGSIVLLRTVDATDLLVLPMGAAFLAFLPASTHVPEARRTVVVALLGVWTLVYLVGFLRQLDRKAERHGGPAISAGAALGSAIAAALFACLAGVLLIVARPAVFVVVLAGASALVAFVASRSGKRVLLLAAMVLGAVVIGVAAPSALDRAHLAARDAHTDPAFLAALALWALTYLAGIAEEVLRRRAPFGWVSAITASGATLGFLAAALLSTSDELPTLRALLTAGAGCADLALGAVLLARRPRDRDRATLLVGQALGLFAAAIAFGLSGATVTVLWAALSAVAAVIAARTGDRVWLAASAVLFAATLTRLLGVDVAETSAVSERFFATRGREGAVAAPVFWNARCYAMMGIAAALLLSARFLSRARPFRPAAAASAVAGYALLLALAVIEARAALTHLPPSPPFPLDGPEWVAFDEQVQAVLAPQRAPLDMMTTLLLAAAAAALLVAGFAARDAFHRYLGLSLFGVTVGKLVLWDVWHIDRIHQIGLLTGVGGLLVGGGFLYARFGRRLVALVRDGHPGGSDPPDGGGDGPARPSPVPPAGVGVVVLLALLGASGRASAEPPAVVTAPHLRVAPYATVRPIAGIDAPGDYRFEVDLDLYHQSLSSGLLDDLRIAGPDGSEVPYLLRELGTRVVESSIKATMVDPGTSSDGAVSAMWSIEPTGRKHCRLELSITGDTFLRRVRVETGETPKSLLKVAEGAYVYRIQQGGFTVQEEGVRYPLSLSSLVRVTLLPEGSPSRVSIRDGTVSCAPEVEAEAVQSVPLTVESITRDEAAKTTTATLDAGMEGLPLRALRLEVGTPEFSRNVELTATNYRTLWAPAGSGLVYRIEPRPGVELSATRVPLSLSRKRWLRVTVSDGDSAPLELKGVTGEVRTREVIFRAASAGDHRLFVGDKNGGAARYDLAEILAHAERAEAPRAAVVGAAGANPGFGVEETPVNLPFTEQHRTAVGGALAAVLLGLSVWAIRLLRKGEPAGKE